MHFKQFSLASVPCLILFKPLMEPYQVLGQSGPKSNRNEGVICLLQSSSITGVSPSDYLVSYPRHSLKESYSSAEIQSVYSVAPADLARGIQVNVNSYMNIFLSYLNAE